MMLSSFEDGHVPAVRISDPSAHIYSHVFASLLDERGHDSLRPHFPPWELTCDACSCSTSVTACLLTSRSRVCVGSNIASWWGNGVSTALGVERLVLRMGGSYPPCAGSAVMVLRAAPRLTFIEGGICLGDSRSLLIAYVVFCC